ncbi:MAG: GerMN domain-containing protein [Treponema sp.]|jgi:hypothetical protein|nr:GerMN domain-containing protein [Treponema sp.]
MKPIFAILSVIIHFFAGARTRRFLYLVILLAIAFKGAASSDMIRRTFVFYNMKDYTPQVEEHMVLRSRSDETAIRMYAEETLFGPRNPESAPLFPRETKLLSLFHSNGTVYINLSETAVFPIIIENTKLVTMEDSIERSFSTFRQSLIRNFQFIKKIKFFIEGHSIDF